MTLRRYIVLMAFGTILTWSAWGLVLSQFDPASAGWLGFSMFYVSLYLALVGTFSLLGLTVRRIIYSAELPYRQVAIAFRQSFSFAFLVVAALFLQSRDLLTWWNVLFLVVALTFLEFAVLAVRRPQL